MWRARPVKTEPGETRASESPPVCLSNGYSSPNQESARIGP